MRFCLRAALVLVASAAEGEDLFNEAHELFKGGKAADAVEKLKDAAKAGHGVAADQLGHILHVGEHGTEKDIDGALGYYQMASEIEHPQQMHSLLWLGNMLIEQKKDAKGAQAVWEKCARRLKDFVNVEGGDISKDVRNTHMCARRLVETFACSDNATKASNSKKCEEFGAEAVQDLAKSFEYFLLMADALREPHLKAIAAKSLRSGQWFPPGWKDEPVTVTIDEAAAERFEKEHESLVEYKKNAKAAKMKMAPDLDRAKQHAMKMKDGGKKGKHGKHGKHPKGKKGKMPHHTEI